MKIETTSAEKKLNIVPTESSAPADFDFLLGKWWIHNRKLNRRLVGCDEWTEFESVAECGKILNGFGNADSFRTKFGGKPFEGRTLRIFNPTTRLWSIYWADSERLELDVPQVGSFEKRVGEFLARDLFEGIPIIVKFVWDATDREKPVWRQAFSADEGATWELNWEMIFSRQD